MEIAITLYRFQSDKPNHTSGRAAPNTGAPLGTVCSRHVATVNRGPGKTFYNSMSPHIAFIVEMPTSRISSTSRSYKVPFGRSIGSLAPRNIRASVALNIGLGLAQIVQRRFRRHKGRVQNAAGSIIDISDSRGFRHEVLEPIMPRTINLSPFARTFTPTARLINLGQAVLTANLQPVFDHLFSPCLARDRTGLLLLQLRGRQCWSEVGASRGDPFLERR
jgi:hypothetical protein